MVENSIHSHDPSVDSDVDAALTAARTHAAAAAALASMAMAGDRPDSGGLSGLASSLKALAAEGLVAASAAELVEARIASGSELSTNMLRLVAESLSSTTPDPQVVADTRRAVRNTPSTLAPLSTAFSGLSLITRALSARHGRDIDLTVAAEDVQVPEAQMDDWRQAAMLMACFALDASRKDVFQLAFKATAHGGAVSLSLGLPTDLRPSASTPVTELLADCLDGEAGTRAMEPEGLAALAPLEEIAARLGGSLSLETTNEGRRMTLLARRVQGVAADSVVRRQRSLQARRVSAMRAVAA